MNDYGRGGLALGAATALPATSAIALWSFHRTNKIIILGLFALSLVNLVINIAMIARYTINSKK